MAKLVPFTYTIRNGVYLPDECLVMINIDHAKIIGWKINRIWNDRCSSFIEERVFVVVQGETEYSALIADEIMFRICNPIIMSSICDYVEDDYIKDDYVGCINN